MTRFALASRPDAPVLRIPEVAAAVAYRLVDREVEFLLVRTGAGAWTFPKGHVDPGETTMQAAAREALEEAGARGDLSPGPLTTYRHRKHLDDGRWMAVEVTAHLLEVRERSDPKESYRAPRWFARDAVVRALSAGRSPMHVAELARVVDEALRAVTEAAR